MPGTELCDLHMSPHRTLTCELGNIMSPMLQMRNLRLREVKWLIQSHTENKWQSQNLIQV